MRAMASCLTVRATAAIPISSGPHPRQLAMRSSYCVIIGERLLKRLRRNPGILPEEGGGGGGGSTPPSPPGDPEPPSGNPETPPEEPEYPTELPDPNNPESPERITILVNGVPTSYIKVWDPELEEWVYLMESEVPLSDMGLGLPKTGDDRRIILGMMLAAGSLCGMGVLSLSFRKRRDK